MTETPAGKATPAVKAPPGVTVPPASRTASSSFDAAVLPPVGGSPLARTRRMRLTVHRIDPWTVLRLAFLLSVAVAIVTVVTLFVLWGLLAAGGVFSSLDQSATDILGSGASTFTRYFSFSEVAWVSMVLATSDVILITALATIAAFLFNLATSMAGGLELTVQEDA